jgi:hypothetical protein
MPPRALLERIRAEYLEMPGLRLTLEQAQRLYGVERTLCQQVLAELVEMQFLRVTANGSYARTTEGADYPRPTPVRAHPGNRGSAIRAAAHAGLKRRA